MNNNKDKHDWFILFLQFCGSVQQRRKCHFYKLQSHQFQSYVLAEFEKLTLMWLFDWNVKLLLMSRSAEGSSLLHDELFFLYQIIFYCIEKSVEKWLKNQSLLSLILSHTHADFTSPCLFDCLIYITVVAIDKPKYLVMR